MLHRLLHLVLRPVVARSVPSDRPDQAKYFLAIDSKLLSFAPAAAGGRVLRMNTGICTFDRKGKALQYFSDRTEQPLTDKEFAGMAAHAVPHAVQFSPAPNVSRVRLDLSRLGGHLFVNRGRGPDEVSVRVDRHIVVHGEPVMARL